MTPASQGPLSSRSSAPWSGAPGDRVQKAWVWVSSPKDLVQEVWAGPEAALGRPASGVQLCPQLSGRCR